jgi:hypothetical protein
LRWTGSTCKRQYWRLWAANKLTFLSTSKPPAGLREALVEIERLRSDAALLPKVLAENPRLRFDTGLRLKAAAELREARAEIERLRSDHLKTAAELREALAEIEHLWSDVQLHA